MSARLSGQRVVLHVGLPKTGTTHLQGLLADHRDVLREAGVLYPFLRPGAMFHGAVEVRGSHAKFGLTAGQVAGTWQALCDRARDFPGTTVISHEVLAGATPEEIAQALAPLAGLEVHVVVTARDLGRQATAHWQEEVKLGDTRSFADFERDQFRADTAPGDPARPHFWHAQDAADALARWSTAVPPERVHLVVCPAPGDRRTALWERFADAAGIDPGLVDADTADRANASLGTLQIAHLRQVNAALDGRLEAGVYHRLVKKQYAEGVLARQPGERPRTPAPLGDVLAPATARVLDRVRAAGHPVHGDLADLEPVLAGPGEPHPDDVDSEALAALDAAGVAERLVAEARRDTPPRNRLGRVGARLAGLRKAPRRDRPDA
ncbi:hypothetical protein [Nocardioides sp. LS1]|uniref:hypothetical protein n=1 Tax=Nocardioides sp. LS1 TaxID=1027620 RepID=UPI000F6185D3|nr:hypothetical protein [Nocardioides sp. LS1]GCD91625.1 hypothetical protein NLS1_36310 [Nocardioides sp. LS1]